MSLHRNTRNDANKPEALTDEPVQNTEIIKEKLVLHPKATKYIQELLEEKVSLDHLKFPIAVRLIEQEIERVEGAGRAPPKENKYIDLQKNKPIRVTSRVLVPVKEYPKFNFIGKILGPRGNSLRRLQEETLCRILIQGRGSMRDPKKEEELLRSSEPKYNHLADELNVEVSAVGAAAEAHARMAYALAELKNHLTPDNTDYISIEQLEEMERMRESGDYHHSATAFKKPASASFQADRFYETLNKAQASIDNIDYGYRNEKKQYSPEDHDITKSNSRSENFPNFCRPTIPDRGSSYQGGRFRGRYNKQGYGGTWKQDQPYKVTPYDRP